MRLWLDLLSAPWLAHCILASPLLQSEACADACADSASALLGGFVRFPGGQICY